MRVVSSLNTLSFDVVIPARLQSTRLPGKLLMDLEGKTVLERVFQQAMQAQPRQITIATDDEHIASTARGFGADVVMTSAHHASGTSRCAEAVSLLGLPSDTIIVNVHGDEPLIDPRLIVQVAKALSQAQAPMATLCWPIVDREEWMNPNVVKVVRNAQNHALYFSRSPIPAHRDHTDALKLAYKHIGLYAYRAHFLQQMVDFPSCDLEHVEALEQLNVLYAGHAILVEQACAAPRQDINTADDLALARRALMGL